MLVSAATDNMELKFGFEATLDMMKAAGFTAFDLSLFGKPADQISAYFSGDDYLEKAKALRAYTDKIGLPCNQAHAPFGGNNGNVPKDSEMFGRLVRSIEVASVLGAKGIVIHPLQHLAYMGNAEYLKAENKRFYSDLLPYAEKFGIIIYTENMWQRNRNSEAIVQSVCAEAGEMRDYVDMMNSPYFKTLLDIGHAYLTGETITNMVKTTGRDRLFGLHIHDVEKNWDVHTLPYTRSVKFEEMIEALAEIDYQGDITFEAGAFHNRLPLELYPSALRLMADMGHYFVKQIELKKNIEN
ncbi:MAG: sugar phosphate isomerase/epimerase [Clostridia bacterium]|nr:sugar phosphate isomerase/epimerase [Clostridia bacterium]